MPCSASQHGTSAQRCAWCLTLPASPPLVNPSTMCRYSTQLDYRQDYSFMDAPLRNTSNSQGATAGTSSPLDSKVVLRQPVPNRRLPAYLDGSLAWGSPPTEVGRRGTEGGGVSRKAGRGVWSLVLSFGGSLWPFTCVCSSEGSTDCLSVCASHNLRLRAQVLPPSFHHLALHAWWQGPHKTL